MNVAQQILFSVGVVVASVHVIGRVRSCVRRRRANRWYGLALADQRRAENELLAAIAQASLVGAPVAVETQLLLDRIIADAVEDLILSVQREDAR